MAYQYIDTTLSPVVELRTGDASDLQQVALAEFTHLLATNEPYVLLVDGSKIGAQSSADRKMWGEWIKDNTDTLRRLCLGCAIYNAGPVIRGLMTVFAWFAPLPYPVQYFPTREAAVAWCNEQVRAAAA